MLVNATTHKIARYTWLFHDITFFRTNEFKMTTEINEISNIKLETPYLKDNTGWSMCRSWHQMQYLLHLLQHSHSRCTDSWCNTTFVKSFLSASYVKQAYQKSLLPNYESFSLMLEYKRIRAQEQMVGQILPATKACLLLYDHSIPCVLYSS